MATDYHKSTRYVTIKRKKKNKEIAKFYIIISKKAEKNATRRNLLRRRSKEILRDLFCKTKIQDDIFLYYKEGASELSFRDLKRIISNAE